MWRAWVLLSTLVFSVLFRWFDKHGKDELNGGNDWTPVKFPFHDRVLNLESYTYFTMEHLIAVLVALLLLFKDSTPKWIFILFVAILVADWLHFVFFFRDEGIGFNLAKVVTFGIPLLITELWRQLKQLRNQE